MKQETTIINLFANYMEAKKLRRERLSNVFESLMKTHSSSTYINYTDEGINVKGFYGAPPDGLTVNWEVLDNPNMAREVCECILHDMREYSQQAQEGSE